MIRAAAQDGSYPRPQLVRERWTSLDGTWGFGYDDADEGVREEWFATGHEARFDRSIVVPFPPESPASGIGDPGFHPVVWYQRPIDVAALISEADLAAGSRLLVHFGAVDFEACIWFGGQLVGEHTGGQTPFSLDLTDWLTGVGEHRLVVRAKDDPLAAEQPRGKQDWELTPHGIWYDRTTGIWQSVWCEVVPPLRVSDIWWTTDFGAASVRAELTLSLMPEPGLAATIALRLDDELLTSVTTGLDGQRVVVDVPMAALADRDSRARLLWAPDHPVLLDAEVWLHPAGDPAHRLDEVASYLGVRSVAVAGGGLLLNDELLYLRAVLAQGYWPESHLASPSSEALRREVELVKELGFNTVRVHQKAEDPRFLLFADQGGLLVWGETANAREFSPTAVQLLSDEWADIVRRDRSHPCVVAWVPLNESWGADEVASAGDQQAFLRRLADLTRSLDPTRPVLSNEGWEHVDSDILGVHDYTSRPVDILDRYGDAKALEATIDGAGPQGRRLIVDDAQRARFNAGGTPAMLTEFGGISYAAAGTWGYSTVESDDEFIGALRGLFGAVRSCAPLSGFCFTQLTDTRQEANGLLTADRSPKIPVDVIHEIVSGPLLPLPAHALLGRSTRALVRRARVRLRPVRAAAVRLRQRWKPDDG